MTLRWLTKTDQTPESAVDALDRKITVSLVMTIICTYIAVVCGAWLMKLLLYPDLLRSMDSSSNLLVAHSTELLIIGLGASMMARAHWSLAHAEALAMRYSKSNSISG